MQHHAYWLEQTSDLSFNALWTPVGENPVTGTGQIVTVNDTNAPTSSRFYRVRFDSP